MLAQKSKSRVFPVGVADIAEIFHKSGVRIFARNVRGYLGSTKINKNIEKTLADEPENFWYYNNGITIVCDQAEHVTRKGRNFLKVENPQIINGQQTTRTLSTSQPLRQKRPSW